MAEKIFDAQSNYGWGLSLNMTGKAPAVAKRIWNTYADALAYVNDYKDSAIEGLRLTVIADPDKKKNGVYYIEKAGTSKKEGGVDVANNDGILSKVGPIYTQTATNYSEAVTFANEWTVGQLIKVSSEQTIGEQTYRAGFYIVEGTGTISALATSSGADADLGALTARVSTLETNSVDKTTYTTDKTELENKIRKKVDTSDLIAHKGDKDAHITAEERANWNNTYTRAETFVNEKIAELDLNNTFDTKGAADAALTSANNYTNSKVDGKFDASGAAANALTEAKAYTDGKDTAMSTRVSTLDGSVSALDGSVTVLDGRVSTLDGSVSILDGSVSALDRRVTVLEGKDYEQIAATAASAAVATVVDNAPENFDTLKEIATWISNNNHANDVATLLTDVTKLKAIDHNAYIAADDSVLADAKTYTDGEIKDLRDAMVTSVTNAINHSDTNDATTLASAKKYTDDEIKKLSFDEAGAANTALETAKSYADGKDASILKSANKHSDDNDASTLESAKQYVIDNTNGFLKEDTLPIATESDIVSLFA